MISLAKAFEVEMEAWKTDHDEKMVRWLSYI